jgi:hypothetical protein
MNEGALGLVLGTTAGVCDEKAPVPAPFLAATLKMYEVPFTKFVTVAVVRAEVPSLKVNHVVAADESAH